jgi:hypothetical protein
MKQKFGLVFILTMALVSCKASVSGIDAARETNHAFMVSEDGVFQIQFFADAFSDGMDTHYFGEKTGMTFQTSTSGLTMKCQSQNYCYIDINLKSKDFSDAFYKYANGSAGLWALLIGPDAQTFYEEFLSPWSSQNPKRLTYSGIGVLEYEKTVFINYDKIGQIFCKKRTLDLIGTEVQSHYACWFTYQNAFASVFDAYEYTRNSTRAAWKSMDDEIIALGLD